MVPAEINTALAWLHIFSAIGWMGTAMFLAMVLSPSTAELPPQSRRDLVLKLFPRFMRYVTIFATLTLVFGVLLGLGLADNSPNLVSTAWGIRTGIGAVIAVVAYALALGVGLRSARQVLRLAQKAQQDQSQVQPSEMARLTRRMRIASSTVVLLLSITLIFMVAASRL